MAGESPTSQIYSNNKKQWSNENCWRDENFDAKKSYIQKNTSDNLCSLKESTTIIDDLVREYLETYDRKIIIKLIDNPMIKKQFLLKIATENSNSTFMLFEYFKSESYAREVLVAAAKKNPFEWLNWLTKNPSHWFSDDIRKMCQWEILLQFTQENPGYAFQYYDIYKNDSYAKEILCTAVKLSPIFGLRWLQDNWSSLLAQDVLKILKQGDVLSIIAKESPEDVFNNFDYFKNESYIKDILIKMIMSDPFNSIAWIKKYWEWPLKSDILAALKWYFLAHPEMAFDIPKDTPYRWELFLNALPKYSWMISSRFSEIKHEPFARDLLLRITGNNPSLAFDYFDTYKDMSYAKEIFMNAVKKESYTALSWLWFHWSEKIAVDFLFSAENKELLIDIALDNPSRIINLFPLYKNTPFAKEILFAANSKDIFVAFSYYDIYKSVPYAKELLIKAAENINNEELVESEYLYIWRVINDFHEEGDDIRFMIISKFDENRLYQLIVQWRAEIFTSTYNGIIKQLLWVLAKNGKDIYDVIKTNDSRSVATFIEAATSYGKIDQLFTTIRDDTKKKEIIDIIFDEKNIEGDTARYVALMEIVNKYKSGKLLDYMGMKLQENYEKSSSKDSWWIIVHYVRDKFPKNSFFSSLPKKYEITDITKISSSELFDSRGRNVQQYFFYNDKDGKASYQNFLSKYRWNTSWKIKEDESFITITSQMKNGKSIIIYANKPEHDGETEGRSNWFDAITADMKSYKPPLESMVIVHRWHSYHADKTIARIPPFAKMVFLGSCGWFQNIGKTLSHAWNAHIISTKWVGTMAVNDTLFKAVNDQIFSGKGINWKDIWWKVPSQLKDNKSKDDFFNYVRPDENIGALFYSKKQELESKRNQSK
jgi:hypothetical protein